MKKLLAQNSKAIGAGTGAAIATLIVWGLRQIPGFQDLPIEAEAAIGVMVTAIITWWFPANEPVDQLRRS